MSNSKEILSQLGTNFKLFVMECKQILMKYIHIHTSEVRGYPEITMLVQCLKKKMVHTYKCKDSLYKYINLLMKLT